VRPEFSHRAIVLASFFLSSFLSVMKAPKATAQTANDSCNWGGREGKLSRCRGSQQRRGGTRYIFATEICNVEMAGFIGPI